MRIPTKLNWLLERKKPNSKFTRISKKHFLELEKKNSKKYQFLGARQKEPLKPQIVVGEVTVQFQDILINFNLMDRRKSKTYFHRKRKRLHFTSKTLKLHEIFLSCGFVVFYMAFFPLNLYLTFCDAFEFFTSRFCCFSSSSSWMCVCVCARFRVFAHFYRLYIATDVWK